MSKYLKGPKQRQTKTWSANSSKRCLKQSPRPRYEIFSTFLLEKLGLKRTYANHSIFISEAGLNGPIVSTFIDDIKIMGPKGSDFIRKVKAELATAFSMVDMGPISFDLGLKVIRDREKKRSNYPSRPTSTRSLKDSTSAEQTLQTAL